MADTSSPSSLIDHDTAGFIQRFVSINIATRNNDNQPAVARAAGCDIAPDGNSLTVYLASSHNQTLLDNLGDNQCLAVVFSRPSTNRTIQFKGNDAKIRPLTTDDQIVIDAYFESFLQELSAVGFPPAFCEAMHPSADEKFVAICFTPERAYSQTPGPNAGEKL
jgi:hypothetical protein